MRKMLLAIFLISCLSPVCGMADDIPEALFNAKTALVENARAEDKDVEKLTKELQKWGRFEIVTDRSKADITITLTRDVKEGMVLGPAGRMLNQQSLINIMHIYKTEGSTLLWKDETSTYSKDPKALVSKLKSKLKKKK